MPLPRTSPQEYNRRIIMQSYRHFFIIFTLLTAIFTVWRVLPAAADTVIPLGITGVFISAVDHTLQAEIRVLYAGMDAYARAGKNTSLIGTTTSLITPSSALMRDDRGQVVSLDRIPNGTFFNASAYANVTDQTITVRTIYFGTRLSAPRTFPDVSPVPLIPRISFSPTPLPVISLTPTPLLAPFQEIPFDANVVGTIATVDIPTRTITITLHSIYDIASNTHRLDTTSPPNIISFTLPDAVPMARLDVPIAIVDIKPQDTFNARTTIDLSTYTGSISSIHLISPGPSFNVMTGTIASITPAFERGSPSGQPTVIALKNTFAPEQHFMITPQTVFLVGADKGSTDNLIVGRPVSVAFVMNGNAMEAVSVELGTLDMKIPIEKFFALNAIRMRGVRASSQFDATLQRLSRIIAKQQLIINNLSTHHVTVVNAEKLLSLSNTELSAAHVALEKIASIFDTIMQSTDQKADMVRAHTLLIAAISAEKKVYAYIKAAQQELTTLSKK